MRGAAALAAAAILLTSCAGADNEVATGGNGGVSPSQPPSWIVDLEPGPGVSMRSVSVVEVRHRVTGADETVRLVVDGVDVTSSARVAPGRLHYDPAAAEPVVPLDPGEHTAVVKRMKRSDFGSRAETVDSYRWTFTIR